MSAFKSSLAAAAALFVPASPLCASPFLSKDESTRFFGAVSKGDFVAHADTARVDDSPKKHQVGALREAVLPWKVKERALKKQWEDDEDGFSKLPARAWPPHQPDADQQGALETEYLACQEGEKKMGCEELAFNLATCLVFNNLDPVRGLELYKQMAAKDHVDSMVAAGVVLLEGLGVPFDESQGLKFLTSMPSLTSAQGRYEYAGALYTGVVENIPEPEKEAFQLFKKCAESEHTGGLFMTAEMIYMGEVEGDLKEAVPMFASAADKGHRMARQRMRQFFKL